MPQGPKGLREQRAEAVRRAGTAEIVWLRDEAGLSWAQISDSIEQRLCRYQGHPFDPSPPLAKRAWSRWRCRRGYKTYQQILKERHEPA